MRSIQMRGGKKRGRGRGPEAQTPPGKRTLTEGLDRPEGAAPPEAASGPSSVMDQPAQSDSATSDKPTPVQAKGAGDVSFGANLQTSGGGSSMPEDVQAKMEDSFGADFSDVRVHNDGQAEQLGAQAFAVGSDVHFAQGKYDPSSSEGQSLLGHELSHVVQQREGRVSAPAMQSEGNATVVQNSGLEAEADAEGARAAAGQSARGDAAPSSAGEASASSVQKKAEGGAVVQQQPIIQGVLPAALAGIGAALSSVTAAQAATVAGTVITGMSAVAGAAAPVNSGVASYQFDSWFTQQDTQKLERIAQVRLINAYVAQWVAAHPDQAAVPNTNTNTPTNTTTSPPAAGNTGQQPAAAADPGPTASGGQVDQTIMAAVATTVRSELTTALNTNQHATYTREYIWSDSGAHTADAVGTVGAIQVSQVKGAGFEETLALRGSAAQIPALQSVPGLGTRVVVRQFRGGRVSQGPSHGTGWGDSLAINVIGGKESHDEAANSEHGSVTLSTEWKWDGNATTMDLEITIGSNGWPDIAEPAWHGTPDDFGWW